MVKFSTNQISIVSDAINLLSQLKGQRIMNIVRLIDGAPSSFLKIFPDVTEDQVFALGGGPVFLMVESGLCVGFNGSERDYSIVVWNEVTPLSIQEIKKNVFLFHKGYFVECNDSQYSRSYWSDFIGHRIDALTIMQITNEPSARKIPNQRGLQIKTENGRELLLSIFMQNDGPGHFMLMTKEDIRENLREKINLIEI